MVDYNVNYVDWSYLQVLIEVQDRDYFDYLVLEVMIVAKHLTLLVGWSRSRLLIVFLVVLSYISQNHLDFPSEYFYCHLR
jgi:hypothetical protein